MLCVILEMLMFLISSHCCAINVFFSLRLYCYYFLETVTLAVYVIHAALATAATLLCHNCATLLILLHISELQYLQFNYHPIHLRDPSLVRLR